MTQGTRTLQTPRIDAAAYKRRPVRAFALVFLPIALLIAGATLLYGRSQLELEMSELRGAEHTALARAATALRHTLHSVSADLRYLARLPLWQRILPDPDQADLQLLARELGAYAEAKGRYHQVRWLDNSGRERLRVDLGPHGRARVAPGEDLQDKSGRYYFREASRFPPGTIYVSPFDLNVEQGVIELPHRPTLRVAIPLTTERGGRHGILIVNYLGRYLLDAMAEAGGALGPRLQLLNRDGFWLHGPRKEDEWGFMLGRDETFGERHAAAWGSLNSRPRGQAELADGLWSWEQLDPLQAIQGDGALPDGLAGVERKPPRWILAAQVPARMLAQLRRRVWLPIAAPGLVLLLVSALVSALLARAWGRIQALNTDLERQTQVVLDSERYLANLVETAPDAILVIDGAGRIERCNPAAERLFGYAADELLGGSLNRLLPSPVRERHDAYLRRCREIGAATVIGRGREVEGLRRDGGLLPLHVKVGEMDDGRYVGFLRDISERKQAEAELAHYLAQLERSNRELDDFAYIASHDLKEPLRGIQNFSSFLLEDYQELLPEDGRNKLRAIGRLTTRMEDLINNLLHFSRLGRAELQSTEVDMNAVLVEVVESLHLDSREDQVTIRCPHPLPPVRGDRTRIAELLQNLIGNAVKYNDSAEKQVEVTCPDAAGRDLPPGQRLFRVADNGIGIREKHLEKVFDIFKRLHGRDKYGGGSGAGLTIARKVVQRHGGLVWIESEYGKGSRFHFSLPMADPDSRESSARPGVDDETTRPRSPGTTRLQEKVA